MNPNTVIIPCEEEYALDLTDGNRINHVSDILSMMDVEKRYPSQSGWTKLGALDKEAIDKYEMTIRDVLGRAPVTRHHGSLLRAEEDIRACASGSIISLVEASNAIMETYKVESDLASKKTIEMSSEKIKNMLIPLGMSDLQLFDKEFICSDGMKEFNLRKIENELINEFLQQNINELYDGDIITTNIYRIKLISEKMKTEGKLDDEKAQEILGYAVKHFVSDYKILSQCHDKRVDMEDLDFKEYTQSLKEAFFEMGIRVDELDSIEKLENEKISREILGKVLKEKKIQQYLQEHGYEEKTGVSLIERDVDRIKIGEQILREQIIAGIKAGKSEDEILYAIDKTSVLIDPVVEDFESELSRTEDSKEIEEQLKSMGVTKEQVLYSKTDRRYDEIWDEAVEVGKIERERQSEESPLTQEEQKPEPVTTTVEESLIETYEEMKIGSDDTREAHAVLKREIQKEQDKTKKEGGKDEH